MEIYSPRPPIYKGVIEGHRPLGYSVFKTPEGLVHQIISPDERLTLYPHSINVTKPGLLETVVVISDGNIFAGIDGAKRPEFIFNPKTGELEIIGGGIIRCGMIVDGQTKDGKYWFSQGNGFEQLGERIVSFENNGDQRQLLLVIGGISNFQIEITDPNLIEELLNRFRIGIQALIALLFNPQTLSQLKELISRGLQVESKGTVSIIMSTRLPDPSLNFGMFFDPSRILETRSEVLQFVPQIREATPEEESQIQITKL